MSTYLANLAAYVLAQLVESGRQGHLVTASYAVLVRQLVEDRVPDVIALKAENESDFSCIMRESAYIRVFVGVCDGDGWEVRCCV